MADGKSAIYELTLPEVGGSPNTWGTKLNDDIGGGDGIVGLDTIISVPRILRKAATVSGATSIHVDQGSVQSVAVNQATTISFTGWVLDTTPGKWAQRVVLVLSMDATPRVVSWTGVTWLSGVAPVLPVSSTHIIELFTLDNGVTIYGSHRDKIDLPAISAPVVGATTTLDLNTGNDFAFTVSRITTVAFANASANSRRLTLVVTNGAAFAVTWPGSVVWLDGATPVFKNPGVDVVDFVSPDSGTTWYGLVRARNKAFGRVIARMGAQQNIGDNVQAALIFATTDYNVGPLWAGGAPTRLTVPTGGFPGGVALLGQASWTSGGLSWRLAIVKNGVTTLGQSWNTTGSAGPSGPTLQVSAVDHAPVAGDYYELWAFANNMGGNKVAITGTFFAAEERP